MLSDHSEIKLKINNGKVTRKKYKYVKLNNTFLNESWVKKFTMEIRNILNSIAMKTRHIKT